MKPYYLVANGELVPVSEDVYYAYYQMERRERYLVERDQTHGLMYFEDYYTDNAYEDYLADPSINLADDLIRDLLLEKIKACIEQLSLDEKLLIHELFFNDKSEREMARFFNVSQPAIHKRKQKIINKIIKLLKI